MKIARLGDDSSEAAEQPDDLETGTGNDDDEESRMLMAGYCFLVK